MSNANKRFGRVRRPTFQEQVPANPQKALGRGWRVRGTRKGPRGPKRGPPRPEKSSNLTRLPRERLWLLLRAFKSPLARCNKSLQMDASRTPTWLACSSSGWRSGRAGVGTPAAAAGGTHFGRRAKQRGAQETSQPTIRSGQRTLILFSGEELLLLCCSLQVLSFFFVRSLLSNIPECAAATFMLTAGDLNWMLASWPGIYCML